ncbi:MAG TPA: hypothetical protein ENK66_08410, partial [Arcobacter sp.]|nr:hypothetical protein [Arcobacter sp.]
MKKTIKLSAILAASLLSTSLVLTGCGSSGSDNSTSSTSSSSSSTSSSSTSSTSSTSSSGGAAANGNEVLALPTLPTPAQVDSASRGADMTAFAWLGQESATKFFF